MKKNRVLAVLMAVLMMVTLLPSMVFAAAAPSGALDGKLKVKGTVAVGSTLTADYSKVKPEGITDDNVNFSWSLKDGDLLTEVGTDKSYKIEEKDLGLPIVLKISGKEETGISGELTVTTLEVSATEEEAKALAEQKKQEAKAAGEDSDEGETEETEAAGSDSTESADADSTENANTDSVETVNNDSTESTETDTSASTDTSGETVSKETETTENTEAVPEEAQDSTVVEVKEDTAKDETLTYSASAATADGSGVVNFGSLEEGYEEVPEAQYVTITNTGTGDLNFKEIAPENFMVQDINDQPLKSGESVTVYVKPREGLKAGEYKDLITYQTEEGAEAFFEADFTVTAAKKAETETPEASDQESQGQETEKPETDTPEAKNQETKDQGSETPDDNGETSIITIEATPVSLDFGSMEQGYEAAPDAQTVTVKNTGTEAIRLVQPSADNYKIGTISAEVLNSGDDNDTATFTVQPETGLPAGDYSGTIQITEKDGSILGEISVAFKVTEPEPEPDPVYAVEVSPDSLAFGTLEEGYQNSPDAQTVTVKNNGNTKITLQQPKSESGNFTVGDLSKQELEAGGSATFTVQPKGGLSKGEYLEDISVAIAEDSDVSGYVNAHFSVTEKKEDDTKKTNDLTGIKKPADIKDLPNGTEKTQKALKLPDTVTITTTAGEKKASAAWDIKGCSYDPSSSERQTFNVKGTVTLPDGISNPNKISTVIAVSVTVNGYKGTEADPSENKITGIDSNGKYDTNTKITFTAVGAGTDNTSPRKGDTRYQPKSWKITETRTWDAAPYTATFRVSKPGDYTLKVVFGQQKYDGSKWQDTGKQTESSVTFTISQAETLTATPTPAVTGTNQKSAVQTGDSTPIVTFVVILIAAAVCIGGILVYRKKKK